MDSSEPSRYPEQMEKDLADTVLEVTLNRAQADPDEGWGLPVTGKG